METCNGEPYPRLHNGDDQILGVSGADCDAQPFGSECQPVESHATPAEASGSPPIDDQDRSLWDAAATIWNIENHTRDWVDTNRSSSSNDGSYVAPGNNDDDDEATPVIETMTAVGHGYNAHVSRTTGIATVLFTMTTIVAFVGALSKAWITRDRQPEGGSAQLLELELGIWKTCYDTWEDVLFDNGTLSHQRIVGKCSSTGEYLSQNQVSTGWLIATQTTSVIGLLGLLSATVISILYAVIPVFNYHPGPPFLAAVTAWIHVMLGLVDCIIMGGQSAMEPLFAQSSLQWAFGLYVVTLGLALAGLIVHLWEFYTDISRHR